MVTKVFVPTTTANNEIVVINALYLSYDFWDTGSLTWTIKRDPASHRQTINQEKKKINYSKENCQVLRGDL